MDYCWASHKGSRAGSNIRDAYLDSKSPQGYPSECDLTESAYLCLTMWLSGVLEYSGPGSGPPTDGPAPYPQSDRQRIRQVTGREAISGLKGGLLLLQLHHLDGLSELQRDYSCYVDGDGQLRATGR